MKRTLTILLFILVALLAVSCGKTAETDTHSLSLTIKGEDTFAFNPGSLTVPSGTQVTLTYQNQGVLQHNWVLLPEDADVFQIEESEAIGGITTGIIQAGEEKVITFNTPEPGNYTFACAVPGHAAGGMVGTLTVTSETGGEAQASLNQAGNQ